MFDNIPALAPPKAADLGSEINHYLSSDVEHVIDPLAWWHARHGTYPQLSHMALNYLSIQGESVFDFCQYCQIKYFLQPCLSMLSISSAAVDSSSPTYACDSPHSLPMPCFVSECGASATLSWMMS